MMTKLLQILFMLVLLTSCKGENKKIKLDSPNTQIKDTLISKEKKENCYDYLTELVRSSNFPF